MSSRLQYDCDVCGNPTLLNRLHTIRITLNDGRKAEIEITVNGSERSGDVDICRRCLDDNLAKFLDHEEQP